MNLKVLRLFFISTVLLLATLSSCSPNVVHPAPLIELDPGMLDTSAEPYRIGVGDEVEIKFFFTPELDDIQQVRPDGKISLMFAQNIIAAGRTPEELAASITKKLTAHVKQVELVVIMRGFGSQKIYVGGEVAKPGPILLNSRETLTQVIDDAGWLLPSADQNEVVLVRRSDEGDEEAYLININQIITGEDLSQDVLVQAGDMILVPPSGSISLDRWVDRNIRQALPFNNAFVINRGLGPQ